MRNAINYLIEKEIAFLSWMLNILHRLNHKDEVLECYWNARWWDMVQCLHARQSGNKGGLDTIPHKRAAWFENAAPTLIWPTLPRE